jgi:putative endonuclease
MVLRWLETKLGMKKSKKQKSYSFGIAAERYAAIFLWLKFYRVLALRYKNPKGEIDILAMRGNTLVVVEVKARQNFSQCADSITHWKQKKILGAVEWLLAGRGKIAGLKHINERNIRFDVIWVVPWRLPQHLQDAWRL